jgi:hypothetical protein
MEPKYTTFKTIEEFRKHFKDYKEITDLKSIDELIKVDYINGTTEVCFTYDEVKSKHQLATIHFNFDSLHISNIPYAFYYKKNWFSIFSDEWIENPDYKVEYQCYISCDLRVYFIIPTNYIQEYIKEDLEERNEAARKALLEKNNNN